MCMTARVTKALISIPSSLQAMIDNYMYRFKVSTDIYHN